MTPPELRLWSVLRDRPDDLKFRRQHPAGPYTLDFYCAAARLCVEVDGAAHGMGENPKRDEVRDAWMAERGVETMRIPAIELKHNLEGAVAMIVERCHERISSLRRSRGEGDRP